MQGHQDTTSFIQSFTGSHHFVLDYLIEEVLGQQPESIQTFLLRTSILERMCGPLCDAILPDPAVSGQATLEYLQRANLFIVPQDNERHWYRYHHLFGDLLRKRLGQSLPPGGIAELHIQASEWYENNEQVLEAFRHAAAANDIERAGRLVESEKMPLHLRGTATAILDWLESLPKTVLDARPALWWSQAAMLLIIGQPMGVEEKLQATEAALALAALPSTGPDETTRDLIGKIAAARANLAQMQAQVEPIQGQARRALEYLNPDSLSDRSMATRALGFAYFIKNDLTDAGRSYVEAYSLAQAAGDIINASLALIRLGQVQEAENQLHLAAETYQRVLPLIDEYSPYNASIAYIGLARIHYEWNDLDAAEKYGEQSLKLSRQFDQVIDRLVVSEMFLSHPKLARGDGNGAMSWILQAEETSHLKNYTYRLPDIASHRAGIHLFQGNVDEAAQLAQNNVMPLMQARVLIAQGNPSEALALVEPQRQQAEVKRLPQRLLLAMAVQSVVLFAQGDKDKAVQVLAEALVLAEPGGYIRLFVDEGALMAQLLLEAASRGIRPDYVARLLAAFEAGKQDREGKPDLPPAGSLIEPLSPRELEVLKLLRTDLNGPEIARECMVSLSTVRTHTQNIYAKLGVNNRRAAVRRAKELDLL
jgi:LuxR family maltose regulon positive regulatory protein